MQEQLVTVISKEIARKLLKNLGKCLQQTMNPSLLLQLTSAVKDQINLRTSKDHSPLKKQS